jgi:hypothetical protein
MLRSCCLEAPAENLADNPVYREPVSAPNSLITGKNKGNFAKIRSLRLWKLAFVLM